MTAERLAFIEEANAANRREGNPQDVLEELCEALRESDKEREIAMRVCVAVKEAWYRLASAFDRISDRL